MPVFLLPVLDLLKRLPWKWILAALVVSLVLIKTYHIGLDNGDQRTTEKFEAREARAKELALKVQAARQDNKDVAEVKGAARKESIRTVYVPVEKKVIEYVKTPAASVVCLDPSGGMLTNEAIDAANNAIANASR